MKSETLASLAGGALLITIWLAIYVYQPGTQFLAAIASGIAAWATIRLTLAAVRADQRERVAAGIRGRR